MMNQTSEQANEALAAVRASRAKVLEASEAPPVRHAAFAAIVAAYVASPALGSPGRYVVMALVAIAVGLVVRWDRRRTGMFINGYRSGRTRAVTFAVLALMLGLYIGGLWLADARGLRWAPVVFGLVVLPISYLASVWWCRVFRREMLADLA